MFLIKPKTIADFNDLVVLLEHYPMVSHRVEMLDGQAYMIVKEAELGDATDELKSKAAGDLALAEMCFQMNFHQRGDMLCPHCKAEIEKTGEGQATCGHLVFTHFIEGGF